MVAVNEFKHIGAKVEDKHRPILVIFKKIEDKITLFKNLKNLKNADDDIKNISVGHDMTKEEREVSKNLVEQAKEKRRENPECRFRVQGPPGKMKM